MTKRKRALIDDRWVEYVVRLDGPWRWCDCVDCKVEIDADDVFAPLCRACHERRYGKPINMEPGV